MLRILTAGEQGLVAQFGDTVDPAVNRRVHRLARWLTDNPVPGVREIVPTYRSLLVYFDPLVISRQELADLVRAAAGTDDRPSGDGPQRVIRVPVSYGGEFGPDIEFVAEYHGLSVPEVVELHSSVPYLVYMLGFTPGFPYLGGLPEKLATPRLEKPRTLIPAGSVGIAGSQTGFYPVASPGGWQLIGRTPVRAFDPRSSQPFLFRAGDCLQFYPVSPDEYARIAAAVEAGAYRPELVPAARGGEGQ